MGEFERRTAGSPGKGEHGLWLRVVVNVYYGLEHDR